VVELVQSLFVFVVAESPAEKCFCGKGCCKCSILCCECVLEVGDCLETGGTKLNDGKD